MPEPVELGATRVAKATGRRSSTGAGASLPIGMLEIVPGRLAAAALLCSFGNIASVLSRDVIRLFAKHSSAPGRIVEDLGNAHAVMAVFVPLSVLVASLARWGRLSHRTVHRMAIGYWLVTSFVLGLGVTSIRMTPETQIWGISWVCAWISIFPLWIPATPRQVTQVAFIGAVAGSLGILIWIFFFDYPVLAPNQLALMWIPNFIAAVLATLMGRILYRMGRDLERAKQMGSYELVELLGRGGMGEVWRAHHRMLARPAAIKLVRSEFLGDSGQAAQVLQRFEREAQATAALTSPHSVELYDFGLAQDGSFYYVMEYLDGLDLETLVARFGPVPAERAIHFLSQACHSLADAHHHGLIHRDVKPANIYACRMGLEHDFVKVLDFGLVKRSQTDPLETRLTGEMVTTGTPAYVSPEGALGRDLDARADLYSLGCVGYWLLTGKLTFEGKTSMEMLVHHAKSVPMPPSQRTEIPIPPALDAAILWCLEKDPDKRPASAMQLAERLDAIAVAEPWTQERSRGWWEAHQPKRTPVPSAPATPAPRRRLVAHAGERSQP